MAIGDAAVAAGMRLTPGTVPADTIDEEINRALDYIAGRTDAPGTPRAVAKGGTGATTPENARSNLGVPSSTEAVLCSSGHQIRIVWNDPTAHLRLLVKVDEHTVGALAYTSDLSGGSGDYLPTSGGTVTGNVTVNGHVFVPNSSPASSSYAVAYINGDGRLSKNASSARYKDDIAQIDPGSLGDIFPALHSYVLREDDTRTTRYGYIAEHLDQHVDQQPFVVYDLDGRPDSIDFIALLMAQNAQLNEAVSLLAQRLDALEADHAEG